MTDHHEGAAAQAPRRPVAWFTLPALGEPGCEERMSEMRALGYDVRLHLGMTEGALSDLVSGRGPG